MKRTLRLPLTLVLVLISCNSYASGQRTTKVTSEAIAGYQHFTLEAASIPEKSLNYVGSVGGLHLFMITKSSHTSRIHPETGRLIMGRPSNHVFEYIISTDEISIKNGWDISSLLDEGGFTVRPSYCPSITLSEEEKVYTLSADPEVEKACLTMRQTRRR